MIFFSHSVRPTHAQIEKREASWVVKSADVDARVLVNGEPCVGEVELEHHDRLLNKVFLLLQIESGGTVNFPVSKRIRISTNFGGTFLIFLIFFNIKTSE